MSWNARGLYVRDRQLRSRKLRTFRQLLRRSDVAGLQEAHGTESEQNSLHVSDSQTWARFVTHGANRSTGGAMIWLRWELLAGACGISHDIFAPGRVHRVQVTGPLSHAPAETESAIVYLERSQLRPVY